MIGLPDTELLQYTAAYAVDNPELQYTINFTSIGIYTIWLRGDTLNEAEASVYIALDNQPAIIVSGFTPKVWRWVAERGDSPGNLATIEVTQPGIHTLRLWQREGEVRLDRFLMTKDGSYTPNGTGPAKSKLR
jgi:hypothetical protein